MLREQTFYKVYFYARIMIQKTESKDKTQPPYTFEDAVNIADDIFHMQKEKHYHPGAFIHALILTLEATQHSYQIPPQQMAEVKRSARRYIQDINKMASEKQGKE